LVVGGETSVDGLPCRDKEEKMKIARFEHKGKMVWGSVHDDGVLLLTGDLFEGTTETRERLSLKDVKLLPPVVPPKIIGIGLNYKKHIEESPFDPPEVPVIFLKAPTSVIGPLDQIILPDSKKVDYEGELGIVIGRRAKNVKESEAMSYVLGCTIVNDVSARDYHQQDKSFARSKGVDTFCPFGPYIVTGLSPDNLKIETRLNGKTVQSSYTNDLLFNVPQLISFVSKYITLMPGDLMATGTPAGVGPMKKGDVIEVEVEGIGILKNFVS
jgi:2-keto-4-pentenoate hydratase/2-oxohepta-3-ene-1,7-dioic acid hydratase in catechol pathway